jgi:amino acid transporter
LKAAGEVITLPVVVLISLLAQPRLCAVMARDNLSPEIFGRTDHRGNLFWSTILSGIPMTILATVVPFSYLDDCISVGILISFNMTNSSLIIMKCESSYNGPPLSYALLFYHLLAFGTGLTSHVTSPSWIPIGFVALTIGFAVYLSRACLSNGSFGQLRRHDSNVELVESSTATFQAPSMPLLEISMN